MAAFIERSCIAAKYFQNRHTRECSLLHINVMVLANKNVAADVISGG